MAVYEYKREDGSVFEVVEPMSEHQTLTRCPDTGQKCHRLYTTNVTFKGVWPGQEASDKYSKIRRNNETGEVKVVD